MMSIQLLARNMRRAASLRGFSNAKVITENSEHSVSNDETKEPKPKTKGYESIFDKLRTLEKSQSTTTQSESLKTSTQNLRTEKTKTKIGLVQRINEATSVQQLLELSENGLNQQNAMTILSKLSVLTASSQATVKEFEDDYRFLKICRLLSKEPSKNGTNKTGAALRDEVQKSTELEMVLSVAGDEEAAKIVEGLSLPQKVRVLSSLARKKTRSVVVLRSLAHTISSHSGKLNLKECSDVLFAMNSLNFTDELLLSRIGIDINRELKGNVEKTAVVGSIVTSLGFLKFKEPTLLNNLTKWIIDKHELCRPKDLASLLLTLSLVNYQTEHVDSIKTILIPKITKQELSYADWLDFVWALSLLNLHQPDHLESVLCVDFANNLSSECNTRDLNPAQKMKLLNINAVAKHLTENYNGSFIQPESTINKFPFEYRKSKVILINGLLDTLKNLFTTQSYIRTEFNTKMGFVIDAECVLNDQRVPLAVDAEHKDAFRIAMIVLDFHDMCKSQHDPNGISAFAINLLQKIGYSVIVIPYTEFSTSDKVLTRVQYLDAKLKKCVSQSK